jgi:hypothetical protein
MSPAVSAARSATAQGRAGRQIPRRHGCPRARPDSPLRPGSGPAVQPRLLHHAGSWQEQDRRALPLQLVGEPHAVHGCLCHGLPYGRFASSSICHAASFLFLRSSHTVSSCTGRTASEGDAPAGRVALIYGSNGHARCCLIGRDRSGHCRTDRYLPAWGKARSAEQSSRQAAEE